MSKEARERGIEMEQVIIIVVAMYATVVTGLLLRERRRSRWYFDERCGVQLHELLQREKKVATPRDKFLMDVQAGKYRGD